MRPVKTMSKPSQPRMNRQAEKLKALAYHEAGHAIAAHVLGIRFTAVTIVPSERYQGCLKIEPSGWKNWVRPGGCDGLTREQAERQILIYLAGSAAERLVNPEKGGGSWVDDLEASFLVHEILGESVAWRSRSVQRAWKQAIASYLDYMRCLAEELIHSHRRAVRALAKALLTDQEIDAARVGEIITAAVPRPKSAPAILRMGQPDNSPQEVIEEASGRRGVVIRHRETGQVLVHLDIEPFVDVDLGGMNLEGANLAGVTFRGKANLQRALLRRACLQGVTLHYAQFQGAALAEADLRGASFYAADLRHADLAGAHLAGTDLNYANLEQAVLVHAVLCGASLWSTNLSAADLSRAHLTAATLAKANLAGTSLRDACLRGADLRGANLEGADLARERQDATTSPGQFLAGAIYDQTTRWPDGFEPQRHGAVLRDGSSNGPEAVVEHGTLLMPPLPTAPG
jgi:uncharacterized protein YjbI with pentapeptide repeats